MSSTTTPLAQLLVVDDEALQLKALCDTLEAHGYAAAGYGSAKQALAALRDCDFDLVLTDLNMPEMTGIEFLAAAQGIDRNVVGIVMTGQGTIATAVDAMKVGALDFILKPFKLSHILPVLERALSVRRLRMDNKTLERRVHERSAELEAANAELAAAQRQLRDWNAQLEQKVNQKTASLLAENAERKRVEEVLRLNDESLRIALQSVDMTLFRQDRDLRYTWAHCSQSGFGPRDLIGKSDADLLSTDDARPLTEIKRRVLETGATAHERVSIDGHDGRLRYFDLVVQPLREATGEIVGVTGTALDITIREELRVAKEESDALFRGILEAAPDAVVIIDGGGKIALVNPAAEKIFGYSPDSLVGASIETLIPGSIDAREGGAAALPSGATRHLEGLHKDGAAFPAEVALSPLATQDGNYVIGMVRDVTERQKLEQQLKQSQKMEAIGQLTGGVAHDFNNLLGVILGNLDLLQAMTTDDKMRVRIATAQKAGERGADLTKRLLAFSRRQQLNPAPTSLNEAVRNLVEMATRTLGPDVRFKTQLAADVPTVDVDASELENVLLNLAINSRDAMKGGGHLSLSTKLVELDDNYPAVKAGDLAMGTYACVAVADTGCGMPRAVLDRALEPFFTTKPRGKGTGLGLSMAYGFAKQSKGHLAIYSEVGHGTTVRLYLPLSGQPVSASAASPAEQLTLEIGKTVLVVDDEVELLEIAIAYLEDMGLRVLHATDGNSALEVLEQNAKITLLLTDVVMPGGINGVDLARRASALRPGIKVVYSTGFPSTALSDRSGLRLHGLVLNKPYRRNDFVKTIHQALTTDTPTLDRSQGVA